MPKTAASTRHAPKAENSDAGGRTNKGQQRISSILEEARALFVEGGYGALTMRGVADRVGISLSNVQHYFSSREALLKALLQEVVGNYDKAYASLDETPQDPKKKLEGVLRYLLADIKKAETERIFVEIWSIATRDEVARSLLDEMYCYHRKQLECLISEAYPQLRKEKIALRACLVAMQIEGLMLVLADSKPRHPELKGIDEECLRSIHAVLSAP